MEYLITVYYRIEGKPNDLQEIYDQYRTLLNKKLLEEGKDKSDLTQVWCIVSE